MIYFIAVVLLVIGALIYLLQNTKAEIRRLQDIVVEKELELIEETKKARKDSTFRSSAVSWGKTIEHFVPFTSTFPVPPEDVVFLGMPIDYVGFTHTDSKNKCEVHFIEVKSGNAALMGKQRNIKKAIEDGRVYWHEIAVASNRAEVVEE